jgi:type VI secretion system protein ImpA
MAKIELETITDALNEEQPCGPDLDMEYDMDFMNFVAEIDGRIPSAFFTFDPGSLDFDGFYARIGDILQRTRDVRVLVPLAKLRILQADLPGFAETLDALHRLLRERWSDLHPRVADFLELSMGQLATLDDMPNVVLPLQHAPLVRSRRAGAITLRKWQVAKGEVNPRDGEETIDAGTLTSALAESDAGDVRRSKEALLRARDAVAGIRTVCIQEAGYDKAPVLERLPAAIDAALNLIETAIGEAPTEGASPADASGAPAAAATAVVQLPVGAVKTREQAVEAMHVAARYFALREPSSPVPILLREAQAASTKSFYELVNDLVPDGAASAFVSLGAEPWFDVYLSTLDARNPAPDYDGESPRSPRIPASAMTRLPTTPSPARSPIGRRRRRRVQREIAGRTKGARTPGRSKRARKPKPRIGRNPSPSRYRQIPDLPRRGRASLPARAPKRSRCCVRFSSTTASPNPRARCRFSSSARSTCLRRASSSFSERSSRRVRLR